MLVRPMPGVSVASVDATGRLELLAESAVGTMRYRCGPVGTAMWIALRQHEGDTGAAARLLAELWNTAPENARADLDIWVEEMRDAGLMCAEPRP
ncbi:PqqD family peptide modification chaperone [Streptomyces sp. NPDC059832]|uniref:PqqD family peptide modification chaperone n=1 Tax=unclassified Streptomyces TaxID=2593676 RepID=UPI003666E488